MLPNYLAFCSATVQRLLAFLVLVFSQCPERIWHTDYLFVQTAPTHTDLPVAMPALHNPIFLHQSWVR